MPLVSIYMPTRGRPHLVQRAVASVLAQDHTNLELRVVLDGPDPATDDALQKFSGDPRLVVQRLPEPRGACGARNAAIFEAKGEYITGIDDDDEFLVHHVSGLLGRLQSFSHTFVCTTNVHRRRDSETVRHRFEGPVTLRGLLQQNIVGNQVVTRTTYLRELGGFDEKMPAWQDFDLWVRLCHKFGPGFRIDARSYIQHLDHESARISGPERIKKAHARFVQKHAALLGPSDLASLELLRYATSHEPFPLRNAPRYVLAGHGKRMLSALISDRFPEVRGLARRMRSL